MNRREFMNSVSAAIAAASVGNTAACRSATADLTTDHAVGIQLYTVRSLMSANPEGTLAALAEIGYGEVELAGLNDQSARAFRDMLDRTGLKAPASHIAIGQLRTSLAKTLDDAATLGNQWLVVPWIDDAERTRTGYEAIAADFNRFAAELEKQGLGFGYHNHDFEFKPVDGMIPFDLLLERTDPALVKFEIDLFWMRKGERDPLDYVARYPGRFPMVHVKDMAADGRMVNVGAGVLDFARIFAQAERAGIQHYFVEHDNPPSPLEDARVSYQAVHSLLKQRVSDE